MRSLPGRLAGLPPITYSTPSDTLRECVATAQPTIFDIGCNDGQNTRAFLSLFPDAVLHCFEPDPRATARFRARAGFHPNVSLQETVISARAQTMTLDAFCAQHGIDGVDFLWMDASG